MTLPHGFYLSLYSRNIYNLEIALFCLFPLQLFIVRVSQSQERVVGVEFIGYIEAFIPLEIPMSGSLLLSLYYNYNSWILFLRF